MARCLGRRRTGPILLQQAAHAAAAAHVAGISGRVVHFPGAERLTGTVTVRNVLAWTSIDAVHVLSQGAADLDAPLVTRDFVRPRWSAGRLVLDVQPAGGGPLVPSRCRTRHPAEPKRTDPPRREVMLAALG